MPSLHSRLPIDESPPSGRPLPSPPLRHQTPVTPAPVLARHPGSPTRPAGGARLIRRSTHHPNGAGGAMEEEPGRRTCHQRRRHDEQAVLRYQRIHDYVLWSGRHAPSLGRSSQDSGCQVVTMSPLSSAPSHRGPEASIHSPVQQDNKVYYKLHVICGVNPHAVKGGTADLFKKKGKFEYSHINFWATREGSNSAATDPVLFFAECSNDDEDDKETPPLCVPVFSSWISDVRCFHCEFLGKKIVHPYHQSYYGHHEDFIRMARGDHSICNEEIISACDFHADMMCTLQEDWIFFDPNMDAMIARANPIENWAMEMLKWKNRIF